MENIHREVAGARSRKRVTAIRSINEKKHVKEINFDVGDYVLVAQRDAVKQHKLRVRWRGSKRVVKALSDYIFEVKDLITKECEPVHASRIKHFSESSLEVTETLLDTIVHNNTHYNIVESYLIYFIRLEKIGMKCW